MADPTIAEIDIQFQNMGGLFQKIRLAGLSQTGNVVAAQDTITKAQEGDYAPAQLAAVEGIRATYASLVGVGAVTGLLNPVIREYGKFIKSPFTQPSSILDDLYDYWSANSKSLKSRAFVFDSINTSGTGSGTVHRITKNKDGQDIESGSAQQVEATVEESGAGAGQVQAESWRIYGQDAGKDALVERGTGTEITPTTISESQTNAYISNPSFESVTPTTSGSTVTALVGWTVTSAAMAQMTVELADYYRGGPNLDTPRALKVTKTSAGTIALSQTLQDFDKELPYYAHCAYLPVSATGTLKIAVGKTSGSIVLSAGLTSAWAVLTIPLSAGCWGETFISGSSTTLTVSWITGASGNVIKIDDIIFSPCEELDSLWYAPVGGATAFADNYKADWTDTETWSILQGMLARGYTKTLPTSGTPSVDDPTVV